MASRTGETSIHGRRLVLTPRGLKVNDRHLPPIDLGGDVFYVNDATGTDAGGGQSPDDPFATLDYAIGQCTANNNDVIIVMADHEETVTGAGGITFDVAGITVIGVGNGLQRPRFLMDGATTVTAAVTAADVTIENLVFAGGHNGIATCFDVDADGFTAIDIEFEDNATDEHFLIAYTIGSTTDNTCDRLTIIGNKWSTNDAGPTAFISLTGDTDYVTITDNFVCLDAATAQFLLHASGDDLQFVNIQRNYFVTGATSGDLLIDNDQTDNTGIVAFNLIGHHDTAGEVLIDADGVRQFENYGTAIDTASGYLLPAADS